MFELHLASNSAFSHCNNVRLDFHRFLALPQCFNTTVTRIQKPASLSLWGCGLKLKGVWFNKEAWLRYNEDSA